MDRVNEIKRELRKRGGAQAEIVDEEEAAAWRRDARKAARQLGRPVQTVRHGIIVVAGLRDWPANELERQVTDAVIMRAMSKLQLPES